MSSVAFRRQNERVELGADEAGGELGAGLSPIWQPTLTHRLSVRHASKSLINLHQKGGLWSKFYTAQPTDPNVQRVLDAVKDDQAIVTDPSDNKNRRTILLRRSQLSQPFGFTVQSYELAGGPSWSVSERVRFVSNVAVAGLAAEAGMRAGDVVLSVDGAPVSGLSHDALEVVVGGSLHLRLVLLFVDAVRQISLAERSLKLALLLGAKRRLLSSAEEEERSVRGDASPAQSFLSIPEQLPESDESEAEFRTPAADGVRWGFADSDDDSFPSVTRL